MSYLLFTYDKINVTITMIGVRLDINLIHGGIVILKSLSYKSGSTWLRAMVSENL